MQYDIEKMLLIIKASKRKILLFDAACCEHVKFQEMGLNSLGAAYAYAEHPFEPHQAQQLFDQEREWQYKLLLHMFHKDRWLLNRMLEVFNIEHRIRGGNVY